MYLAYYVDGPLPFIHRMYIGNRTDTDAERPNQGRGTLIKTIEYFY